MASATLNLRWPTSAPPQSWHLLEHDQSLPERQIQHQHHQTKSEVNGKRNSVWLRSHRRKSICQWPGSDSHMHRCLFQSLHPFVIHGPVATTSTTTTITSQPPPPTTVTTNTITTTTTDESFIFNHFHIFHFQFQQLI